MGICMLCSGHVPDHAGDCPFVTEVWPVTPRDLIDGLACGGCGNVFDWGDFYTRRPVEGWTLSDGSAVPAVELVCLGCAAVGMVAS